METRLDDKVALVTGATKGIGGAIASKLARAGCRLALTGRDAPMGQKMAEAIESSGGHAVFIECDLSAPGAPEALVKNAAERWGRLDIVVNCAAAVCHKPIDELRQEDWDLLLQVNLKAPFFIVQAALPWLRESKGCVLNVSSVTAWKNVSNNLVYDTIKAGLNHMTRGLSLDLRRDGIRVNSVMPGGTRTPMLDEWLEHYLDDKARATEIKQNPSVADPEQVADAVVWLVSEEAAWVNGAVIPVDGGFHLG